MSCPIENLFHLSWLLLPLDNLTKQENTFCVSNISHPEPVTKIMCYIYFFTHSTPRIHSTKEINQQVEARQSIKRESNQLNLPPLEHLRHFSFQHLKWLFLFQLHHATSFHSTQRSFFIMASLFFPKRKLNI